MVEPILTVDTIRANEFVKEAQEESIEKKKKVSQRDFKL